MTTLLRTVDAIVVMNEHGFVQSICRLLIVDRMPTCDRCGFCI